MELATIEIKVLLPKDFKPSGIKGRLPIRRTLVRARGAVERMIVVSFGNKGLAAILPLSGIEELGEQGENIHMHTLSHAPKHESMEGRHVGDLGTCGEGTPLNSEETKVMEDDKCVKHHQRGLARHDVDGAQDLRGTEGTKRCWGAQLSACGG